MAASRTARRTRSALTKTASPGLAVRQEQEELLAAVAVDALPRPDHEVDARGDPPERLVAGDVPVVVVVELEVVDVEQGDAVGPTGPQRSGVGPGDVLLHAAAVAETRQLVGERLLQQLEVDPLELGLGMRQLACAAR